MTASGDAEARAGRLRRLVPGPTTPMMRGFDEIAQIIDGPC